MVGTRWNLYWFTGYIERELLWFYAAYTDVLRIFFSNRLLLLPFNSLSHDHSRSTCSITWCYRQLDCCSCKMSANIIRVSHSLHTYIVLCLCKEAISPLRKHRRQFCVHWCMSTLWHSSPGLEKRIESACPIVDKFPRNSFACPSEFWAEKLGLGLFHHNY